MTVPVLGSTSINPCILQMIRDYAPHLFFSANENYYPCSFYLDDDVNVTDSDNSQAYQITSPPYVYVHVVEEGDTVTIQYWFYYAYNQHPFWLWEPHEHDWECMYIVFDGSNLQEPREVGFSQHQVVGYTGWSDVRVVDGTTHVQAYVAEGSHALYNRPPHDDSNGRWMEGRLDWGWQWQMGIQFVPSHFNYVLVWGNDESVWPDLDIDPGETHDSIAYQPIYYKDLEDLGGGKSHPSPTDQSNLLYEWGKKTMWPDIFPRPQDPENPFPAPWHRGEWSQVTPLRKSRLRIEWLSSPAELRVCDSQGRLTGLVNGEAKNEIPNSYFYQNTVLLLNPTDSYTHEVVGTSEGSYGLTVTDVIEQEQKTTTFTAIDIPTTAGASHQYVVDWEALSQDEDGVTVQIDSDGDGVFERSITTDATLQPPEAEAGGPYAGEEGTAVTFDASASIDPDGDALQYRWDFDNDGVWDTEWSSDPTASYTWGDDYSGEVVLEVTDGQFPSVDTASVTVLNVAPAVEAGPDQAVSEGDIVGFSGSFTDPGADTHTIEWDFGDTTTATATLTPTHAYGDNGVYPVTLTVTDDDGGVGLDTLTVAVSNVAPTVGEITAPVDPVQVTTAVNISADFTDPGWLDTHAAAIDWGDGTVAPGTVTEADGSGSATGTHTYDNAGVYTVTLTVTDDDGDSGQSVFQYVVVYDPSAGFVTGGGWIDSPEGAYAPDPELTGKANFGFVSKYKKGQTTPTGETEFQFKCADLNFHSDSYQWLVIAGHQAKYKGTGTINGGGNYGFMLCAIDEKLTPSTDEDLFRIKIWDIDDGDAIVYDNQPGDADDADPSTEIQGGSIVIHKSK